MAGGLSRALSRYVFVRYTRSLFSRSGSDADRRVVARRVHQLRRQLHRLPARARAATSGGGGAGTSTPEVFETRTAMGTPGAPCPPDEIGGPRGTLFRDGRPGSTRGGARRRVDYPYAAEARESHHRTARRECGVERPHTLSA